MICFRTYLSRFPSIKFELDKIFCDMYEIDGNDFIAVDSRLFYFKAHENSTWFLGL